MSSEITRKQREKLANALNEAFPGMLWVTDDLMCEVKNERGHRLRAEMSGRSGRRMVLTDSRGASKYLGAFNGSGWLARLVAAVQTELEASPRVPKGGKLSTIRVLYSDNVSYLGERISLKDLLKRIDDLLGEGCTWTEFVEKLLHRTRGRIDFVALWDNEDLDGYRVENGCVTLRTLRVV